MENSKFRRFGQGIKQRWSGIKNRTGSESVPPSPAPSPIGPGEPVPFREQRPADSLREWWVANREEIANITRQAFEMVEKGLDGMPVPGPKAVFGGLAGILRNIQVNWDNVDSLRDLADDFGRLCSILETSDAARSGSPVFQKRLNKLKSELREHHKIWEEQYNKSVIRKHVDAEHIQADLSQLSSRVLKSISMFMLDSQIRVEPLVEEIQRTSGRLEKAQLAHHERELLEKLHPVAAYHNAFGGPEGCFEGTRGGLLLRVRNWFRADERPIFWLSGLAGTGKSTVARTVADQNTLGASFFFSQADPERRQSRLVIPTLAHQLAEWNSQIRASICKAIAADSDIARRNVDTQGAALLTNVVASICSPLPRVLIVIDALDECEKSGSDRDRLVALLLDTVRACPFTLKIFITSRPEESIDAVFSRPQIKDSVVRFALHEDIEASQVEADIKFYLRRRFEKIAQEHPSVGSEEWPTTAQLDEVVHRSGRLFIYAATVMRFIADPDGLDSPQTRLSLILEQPAADAAIQYKMVDQLYAQLLDRAADVQATPPDEVAQQIRAVSGTLALLMDPLPPLAISEMLGFSFERTQKLLNRLSALFFVSGQSEEVRLYHPSFRDFILAPSRCTDERFFVDEIRHHGVLAQSCLNILTSKLKADVCNLRDPSVPNSGRDDLEDRLREHMSESSRYAIIYWMEHFKLASTTALEPVLWEALLTFCTSHLLHWIEGLSLLGLLPVAEDGLLALLEVCERVEKTEVIQRVQSFLRLAHDLLKAYGIPIKSHALHIYHSALAALPEGMLLDASASDTISIPQLLTERYPSWEADLLDGGHHKWVQCVAFSADGTRVISGSNDFTARIWNALDGAELFCLKGHEKTITTVAFSPDGRQAITGSYDATLRIWDAVTGAHIATLEGHEGNITSIATSKDGSRLASASYDGTVRTWDLGHPQQLAVFSGHNARVTAIAFSVDGGLLASGAYNGTIRVWNLLTNEVHSFFEFEGSDPSVNCVAFSPDGARLVSGANDCTVRVWCLKTHQELAALGGRHNECVLSATFSADGRWITARYEDGRERTWDGEHITTHAIDDSLILVGKDPTDVSDAPSNHSSTSGRFEWNYASGWISWKPHMTAPTVVLCWLPPEPMGCRRGRAFAASKSRVVIGAPNGTVTILDFDKTLSLLASVHF